MIKYQTLGATNSAKKHEGVPLNTIEASFEVKDDYVLTEEDIKRGFALATNEEFEIINKQAITDYETWDKVSGPYEIYDIFDRLTFAERTEIRGLARKDDNVADLWEALNRQPRLIGPPDSKTKERVFSQEVYTLFAGTFGQERADRLFARP